jgi:hypothetical protein
MKTRFILIIVIVSSWVLLSSNIASARDPDWVKMKYDLQAKTLTVVIHHVWFLRTADHISSVEIKINSKVYKTFQYQYNAHDGDLVTYVYDNIEAKIGDKIEVTAASYIQGDSGPKSSSIIVSEGVTQGD